MKRIALLAAAATALVSATPASATTLFYAITGSNGFSAHFSLDDHTMPDVNFPTEFFIFDVAGVYSDGSSTASLALYDAADGGGMTLNTFNFTLANIAGPALYSGTLAQPTLLAFGPTAFYDYEVPTISYRVSAVAAAVPEPTTWAMLLAGFGMIGIAVRRRGSTPLTA
ncbi:PEPxxWA-CTERM sorting domain-containing protein [Sphingomonas sp. PAMC 26617]|uniref:PEPxxWA-CTERM sorting domain-containing protein n=1 Tax=Sphingomonas sp. PAMC 26617 TaxID=1112216 RepID=UPI000288838F|nr:PEPxxWA-CTERM sorting domain-containing protein [Sphingomonas sp. PAMC 26617]